MNADTRPEGFQDVVEGFDTVGCDSLCEGSDGQGGRRFDFLLFVRKTVGDTVNEIPQVGQNGASHHDSDLLDDTDACTSSLLGFLAPAYGFEERKKRKDPKNRSDGGEGASGRVPDILVGMVDIRLHGGDHMGQNSSFRQVGDDFTAFDTSVVVFVDKQGFDDNQNPVNIRSDKIMELVKDAVNNLNKQVVLLVLESTLHQEGEDLVKERPGSELLGLVHDLSESRNQTQRKTVLASQRICRLTSTNLRDVDMKNRHSLRTDQFLICHTN